MSRVIWKGSISFGLVYVPVALYSAEKRDQVSLTMLDKNDLNPVGYKRVNKETGKEVAWDDIVKGYEYEKGEYVLLGDEDFRRANVEATQTVEIVDFVEGSDIPLFYYDKPYYLEPLKKGEKGYVLLRETLRRSGKVGIATVVLRNREHLAAVVPWGNMLVVDLMRFHDELRSPSEFKVPDQAPEELGISKKEMEMAERLVESMVEPWTPEKYRDEYRDDLMRVVEEKIAAGETHIVEPLPGEEAAPRRAEVIDLMSQLKRSVEETEKRRGGRTGTGRSRKTGGRAAARKKRA